MITQERLKEVLFYNEEDGVFTWIKQNGKRVKAGSVAGTTTKEGYIRITIDRVIYRAHRLAWLYVYGKFPDDQLDHINHIKSDNRIKNLRPATHAENQQNHPKRRTNKSGVIGVHWYKKTKKWRAQITHQDRSIHLGYFESLDDAALARSLAKEKYHKFRS